MRYQTPLIEAVLVRRYKRFLADVTLENGQALTVHTPNTGSMMGCCEPGSRIWIQDSGNPDRKYPFSWELVEVKPGVITGVNTLLANKLVAEAIQQGSIPELSGFSSIQPEIRYGNEKSRIDFLVKFNNACDSYVEVKNVTLVENDVAYFPDAVSKRGSKHLRELMNVVANGDRGIIIYCIQRNDARTFSPADFIDPEYGGLLREAITAGVEALAYQAHVSPVEVFINRQLPLNCP